MCINLECGNLAMETWEAMGVSATPSRLENHLPMLRIFAHALLAEGMNLSQIHVYLTHCITKDYSVNCEQSAPSSDQFCHSFWPMERSNYSPGIFSPSSALYHGSQEPPCSVTVPSYINQKGCSWESWGEQTSASLPLLCFPLFFDFSNTAHQDVPMPAGEDHSWSPSCDTPGDTPALVSIADSLDCPFTAKPLAAFLNALHWLLFLSTFSSYVP